MYNYGIGGQERKSDNASEGIADIPQNRTLLVQKLTADAPFRPEIVQDLKTVEDVFAHYQPEVEVEFQDENGVGVDEKLKFNNLGDFGIKGITNQSRFLQSLNAEANDYQQVTRQLKSNKILKTVLENPEAKAAYVAGLQALIKEIEDAEQQ